MENTIDFQAINQAALGRLLELATNLLPGGKVVGPEYVCGDRSGGAGDSLKVNFEARQMGIMHPSAQCMELREQGYRITTEWVTEYCSGGVRHRVVRYRLQRG